MHILPIAAIAAGMGIISSCGGRRLLRKITSCNRQINSSEQVHWVNHIYDETKFWPNSAAMYANVHGFEEAGGTYWVGVDIRSFFIRTADYVIKCKNKSTYDEYINMYVEDMLHKMRNDPRLNYQRGDSVNTEFIFKWGSEDKSFNVHLGIDSYAEEK